ncbi:hypothetical protein GYMLUDRAFT_179913 [Collybiopsis luxurians FD-317 M1]|uniref:MYND-type domain-containing protein n=1 Tax=Collybiopsis luxurians FD-317 M1 TaxID=944289 RepID=A0A0D0AQQ0_9AGAR|nr:hypothetical protein GYMLUDRAFT_179913 [Collybiopsis luxurians FD-317 M1]
MFVYRHPEPNMIDKIKVTCPEIQVRGTWEKLLPITQGGLRPNGRCAHSSWVWRGRLYICSGVNEYQMEIKDMWYLDLKTNIWKQLPSPPTKRPIAGLSSVRPTRVWRDKVYLFVGTQNLHVFDLVTEQWSTLKTTMQRGQTWPYSVDGALTASASALLDDKLYIFGGEDGGDPLGQNIFMALDLTTAKWTHVSGTSANIPKSFEPNLRTLPCMWASPLHRKIYLLYGSANRTQARLQHKPGSGEYDYTYEDFWSWDVDAPSSSSSSSGIQSRWTRERLRGNFPSPRTEAASVYWDATGRAVVYGGYHGSLPTIELNVSIGNQQPMYDFTFFGDTFVHDPETNVWQHVLVRGFPSYRAMATIASDPDTGKVYLFGGYTNPDFVPAKNITGRVYHDVWTLKLDLPGGNWNPEDLHRDMRAEKMGPWMRCFTCGNCGISWQKCAGACGGKYYFCSKECQKAGWKEHKEKHGCKKL